MPTLSPALRKQLEKIAGARSVITDSPSLEPYTHDAVPLLKGKPIAAVLVRTAAEISGVMRLAYKADVPVVARGGGTGLSGGAVPPSGSIVLDTTPMNRILEIDTANLTAWAEAGVITADFQKQVDQQDLFYPPDPGSAGECTLGGNVAENAGGIRGLKYGVTRNYVQGMKVVLPQGDILQLGGKSIKDVAGYDLKNLLVGSEGTLAIFTELLLRLLPKPEATATWLVAYPSIEAAGAAVAELIQRRLTPACLELVDRLTWRAIERYLGQPVTFDSGAMLLLEIDGSKESVAAESSVAEAALRQAGAAQLQRAGDAAEAEAFKKARRCAFMALSTLGSCAILEDAAVPRTAVPRMIEAIEKSAQKHRVLIGNFGHAGDGNLHPTCLIDGSNAKEYDRADAAFKEIYAAALDLGGTITGEHGVGLTKRDALLTQWSPAGIELLRRTKAAFDPKALLNPGKIFRGRRRCE